MKVILGTAHGSNVGGKMSPDGKFREYKWSRQMCRMIKEALIAEGIDSYIDIEEETEKSLNDRVRRVNAIVKALKPEDCIYVSIHVNAAPKFEWSNATGCTVFVHPTKASERSKKLALIYYEVAKENELLLLNHFSIVFTLFLANSRLDFFVPCFDAYPCNLTPLII